MSYSQFVHMAAGVALVKGKSKTGGSKIDLALESDQDDILECVSINLSATLAQDSTKEQSLGSLNVSTK